MHSWRTAGLCPPVVPCDCRNPASDDGAVPLHAVVATPELGDMLRRFFADVPGADPNLNIVVLDRDDLSMIPDDAPTYITQSARDRLGAVRVPGRVVPAARTIAAESAREIFAFIVRSNSEALGRLTR